jgi:hypothetical protein
MKIPRWLAFLVPLFACNASTSPVQKKYPPPNEVRPFSGYTVPGLTLYTVTGLSAADRNGDVNVVGVDASGKLVEGLPLFQAATQGVTDAVVLAERAIHTIVPSSIRVLDRSAERSQVYPAEEWALIEPPSVANGVLTFWGSEGEMHPAVLRVQVNLADGTFERRPAAFILHPPEDAIPGIRALLASEDIAKVKEGLQKVSEWKVLAPDVEALLDHPDSVVRMMAFGVLTNLKQPRSIPALANVLEHGQVWGDRSLAGQALLGFKTPEATAIVRAHVAKGGNGEEIRVLRELLGTK